MRRLAGDQLVHRRDQVHGDRRIDRADRGAKRRDERRRRDARANGKRDLRVAVRERQIQIRIARRILGQAAVLHLADDADDREPRVGGRQPAEFDPLADRILPGPEALHETVADDDGGRRRDRFGVGKRAAGQQRNAQRAEEFRRHAMDVRARRVLRVGRRLSFRAVKRGARIAVERDVVAQRHGRDAGHGAQPLEEGAAVHDRWRRPLRRGVRCRRRSVCELRRHRRRARDAEMQREHRVGFESGVQRGQIADRPDHQSGADEQHDGERELGDHQHVADPLRSAAVAAPRGLLERSAQIDAARLPRGRQADEDAARDRHGDRERGDAQIETGRHEAREGDGALRDQRADRRARKHETRRRAEQREHAAFSHQLAQQPRLAGAERRPDGNLAAARFRSRQ